ncbi:MAG: hypothetical protein AAGJ95_17420, partial [Cyanobacteria bacterium J06554_11]
LNELSGIDLTPFRPAVDSTVVPEASAAVSDEGEADEEEADEGKADFSLQGWLINLTAAHINQVKMPDVESIHYVLKDAPPPLWCYTERALDGLSARHRLMILMAQTFEWSDTRIAAYLQAEGEQVAPQEVQAELQVAYQALERAIPEDMRSIYLDYSPAVVPGPEVVGLMTIEFDEVDLQQT